MAQLKRAPSDTAVGKTAKVAAMPSWKKFDKEWPKLRMSLRRKIQEGRTHDEIAMQADVRLDFVKWVSSERYDPAFKPRRTNLDSLSDWLDDGEDEDD